MLVRAVSGGGGGGNVVISEVLSNSVPYNTATFDTGIPSDKVIAVLAAMSTTDNRTTAYTVENGVATKWEAGINALVFDFSGTNMKIGQSYGSGSRTVYYQVIYYE